MILPKDIFESTPSFKKTNLKNNLYKIRFKSEVNTFNKKNDNVYLLLKDTEKKNKACILVHGLGMEIGSKWDTYLRVVPETIGACYIDLPHQRHRKNEKGFIDFI